jgi:hypothetical protein
MNNETNEQFNLYSIIEYISENFIGLLLLIFAFFIIYFVDYINHLNNIIIFSPQIPVPVPLIQFKTKSKKFKKH